MVPGPEQIAQSLANHDAKAMAEKCAAIRADFEQFCEKHGLHCYMLSAGFTPTDIGPIGPAQPVAAVAMVNVASDAQAMLLSNALIFELNQAQQELPPITNLTDQGATA